MDKTRILVVDDTQAIRYSVTRALKNVGYEVIESTTGHAGIELSKTNPDLIILDIQLPDMTGYQVVEKLSQDPETASIPIIHISATNISNEDQALGLEGGADAYLLHPIDPILLVATVRAVLRMRKAEKQLRTAVAQLELQRELREQFVSSLTHDLRTPLTAARMNAQMVTRNLNNVSMLMKHSSRLIENVDRANQMIEDLLDANRIRAGEEIPLNLSECNLKGILHECIENLTAIYGARFEIDVDSSANGYWDCEHLSRAIDNLCSNAIKYGDPHEKIRIKAAETQNEVVLAISNRGNVLSAAEQKTIFENYKRTPDAIQSGRRGWGLGLTLVKGFAKSHGGSVSVESNLQEGTTFSIRLPKSVKDKNES